MAEQAATATKLHVMAAPGCECAQCTFIRNAYECACPRCGRQWQQAFATLEAATWAMAVHSQGCFQQELERQRRRGVRLAKPTYYPVSCGWCGETWAQRFTTKAASQRFLREHSHGCYLRQRQKESA